MSSPRPKRSPRGWLATGSSPRARRHGLVATGTKLTRTDLDWVLDAREALRDALAANNGGDAAKAAARLDRIAARSPVVVRFSGQVEGRFEPGSDGIDGALGRIFAIVAVAQLDDSWMRLRACAAGTVWIPRAQPS